MSGMLVGPQPAPVGSPPAAGAVPRVSPAQLVAGLGGRSLDEVDPGSVYEAALRSPAGLLWVRRDDGRRERLPVTRWRDGLAAGDASLLRRCAGSVLDVGCGPGRLTATLAADRRLALGIDVAPFAVLLARRAGAAALCRDVFDAVPGEGRWSTVLLADGNIGIGGDPVRLLRRAAELIERSGRVLVELEPRRRAGGAQRVRLEGPDGAVSRPFRWAFVGRDEISGPARTAGLTPTEGWQSAGRQFVALSRAGSARTA